jgi:hypothetical protein
MYSSTVRPIAVLSQTLQDLATSRSRSTQSIHTRLLEHLLMLKRFPRKSHWHREIRMNLAIPEILRHKRDKNINLLLLPPQRSREQCKTKPLKSLKTIDLVPAAQFFHERVFGPAVRGPHEHALLHVDEARFAHHLGVFVADVGAHGAPHFATGFAEEFAPFVDVGVEVRAIGGADGEAVVLEFEPAAGFEVAGKMLVEGMTGGKQGARVAYS